MALTLPERIALVESRARRRAAQVDPATLQACAAAAGPVAPAWAQEAVTAARAHRAYGVDRAPGETYRADPQHAEALVRRGFALQRTGGGDWTDLPGRELATEPVLRGTTAPVVACLNLWNDLVALSRTALTWLPLVDAVVVADGPYMAAGEPSGRSSDGGPAWLVAQHGRVTVFDHGDTPWPDQVTKRTALLQRAAALHPGATLLIVDADEFVAADPDTLRLFDGEVGWVTMENPLYERRYGQPRVIRAMSNLTYKGRHHWLYAGDRPLATHQYGGAAVEHRLLPVLMRNERGLGHSRVRMWAKARIARAQSSVERAKVETASDQRVGGREALRVLQVAPYDAGMVGFRFHTALNRTTPHASVFATSGERCVFGNPTQFDLDRADDAALLGRLAQEADVIHCHVDHLGLRRFRPDGAPWVVVHHHGTILRKMGPHWEHHDHTLGALRLVSNPELLQYGTGLHFLPNPVPVARYRRLRAQERRAPDGVFRVAHSPSKRELKGTDAFLRAVERCHAKGLPIEAVLIERLPHAEALREKARCDAAFDSFWLGMQCSGIEAAAMGLPVIAGDVDNKRWYDAHHGGVPYTWAADEDGLVEALERMVTDDAWRDGETARVTTYVARFHDDAAVALRYLDLLDDHFHWREHMSLSVRKRAA